MTTTLQAGAGWCRSWQQWRAARPTARLHPGGEPPCGLGGLIPECAAHRFLFPSTDSRSALKTSRPQITGSAVSAIFLSTTSIRTGAEEVLCRDQISVFICDLVTRSKTTCPQKHPVHPKVRGTVPLKEQFDILGNAQFRRLDNIRLLSCLCVHYRQGHALKRSRNTEQLKHVRFHICEWRQLHLPILFVVK